MWATVSSRSCFCWLCRASPSLAAKSIINLILVLTIWWCPCVESSLVLLEEGVFYQNSTSNTTVIQVYALTSNAEEDEVEWFFEDLWDLLELTPQKRCPFHYRGLKCKGKKSGNTWSNRQICPWCIEWSRWNANIVFQETTLIIALVKTITNNALTNVPTV